MTLNVQRYERKPEAVEAVQLTAENLDEVAAWCGGEVEEYPSSDGEPVRFLALPETGDLCEPPDWVVRRGASYERAADGSFDAQYVLRDREGEA